MHDRAIVGHAFVYRPSIRSIASALWRAEAAWALAIRDCKDLSWALTREWALSIHAAKTSTWALTREWALARDTTVI